jgi:hypothetical protein
MDVLLLLKALDNAENERVFDYNLKSISNINRRILGELLLSQPIFDDYVKKLHNYVYIDELQQLKCGSYLRWFGPQSAKLTQGATFCNIKIADDGIFVVCKGVTTSRCFQLKMDDCLIFQKLTSQEIILLTALDAVSA